MKKTIIWILCICLTVSLWGCGVNTAPPDGSVTFYYYRPEPVYGSMDAVIAPEQQVMADPSDLDTLILAYLLGPADPSLESPFPRDTAVLGWSVQDDVFSIDFSKEFARLSGIDLTIACACIARTFLELTQTDSVVISAEGELLDGEPFLKLSREQLRLKDDSLNRLEEQYTIYYADAQRRYLIPQEISVNLAARGEPETYLIEQLLIPPRRQGLYSPLPMGTRLLGISVEDGLCTVDFSPEFESNGWSRPESQRLALMSVVNTLTALDGIDRVEFSVDGSLLLHYGLLTIPEPLQRDEGMIGPVRTAVNEFDATLYLSNGVEKLLVPVPTRIRQTSGSSSAELIVQQLLDTADRNGLQTGIPEGTQLYSMRIADGLCELNVSPEFLSEGGDAQLAVRVITASLCELDAIECVRVLVDGSAVELWADVLMPQEDWFL